MSRKNLTIIAVVLALMLLSTLSASTLVKSAHAAVACEQTYIVQAGDWLGKLANRFYGDISAYPAIFEATNSAAAADSSYGAISDPDLIQIGQTLCINGHSSQESSGSM